MASRPERMMSWRARLEYPQQHLRDVAFDSCHSDYVLLTDPGVIPHLQLDNSLQRFLATRMAERCKPRCAYIMPVFNIIRGLDRLPRNKTELLRLVSTGGAQAASPASSLLRLWLRSKQTTMLDILSKLTDSESVPNPVAVVSPSAVRIRATGPTIADHVSESTYPQLLDDSRDT